MGGTETRDYDASSWGPRSLERIARHVWAPSTCAGTLRCGRGGATALPRGMTALHGTRVLRRAGAPGGRRRQPEAVPLPLRRSRAGRRRRRRRGAADPRCPISPWRTLLARLAPVGVVAYKPINSHGGCKAGGAAPRDKPCDGEAHVFDFVAALGVPLLPTAGRGRRAAATSRCRPPAFFSVHSAARATPQHLQEAEAAAVARRLTDGVLARCRRRRSPPRSAAHPPSTSSPSAARHSARRAAARPPRHPRRPPPPPRPRARGAGAAGSPSTRTSAARGR